MKNIIITMLFVVGISFNANAQSTPNKDSTITKEMKAAILKKCILEHTIPEFKEEGKKITDQLCSCVGDVVPKEMTKNEITEILGNNPSELTKEHYQTIELNCMMTIK